jgi:deazaflavin-dependent oxidoreductase (nitroreductase family)
VSDIEGGLAAGMRSVGTPRCVPVRRYGFLVSPLVYRAIRWVHKHVANPLAKAALERGLPVPWIALLETTGRRSGEPRTTPVSDGLDGDTFWVIAEHGRKAQYVRNLEADPRVRVKVRGRWRVGHAQVLADEDPYVRLRALRSRLSAAAVRVAGTELMVIRIDLDQD